MTGPPAKRIKCSGCGTRIPTSEPDLVLRKFGGEKQRYYHQRRACIDAAQRAVMSDPAVWFMTMRHVEEGLN